MDEKDGIIPSRRFKGKKVELASTAGIELFDEVAREFMLQIFGLESGDYLITDESSVGDFAGVEDLQVFDIVEKVRRVYGLDVSDLQSGTLLDIFMRIHEQRTKADDVQ